MKLRSIHLAAALCFALGCSSSSSSTTTPPADSGSDTGGTCGISDKAKVISVTKKGGDALCPNLTPDQLNGGDDAGTSDGGSSGCQPVIDTKACTAKIDCNETDADGTKTKTTGSFTKDGTKLVGDITVVVTPSTGSAITCTYSLVLQ